MSRAVIFDFDGGAGKLNRLPCFAIARRGKAVAGTEIEKGILFLDGEFARVAHGKLPRLVEWGFEDFFAVQIK